MTIQDFVPWAQVASTLIAAVGIGVSVWLGIASLNNSRKDRLSKIEPNLLFNIGGQEIQATMRKLVAIPGLSQKDPDVVNFLKSISADQKALYLDDGRYGQLFNHGAGTALSISIWFRPERITVDDKERPLDPTELSSPPYTREWNIVISTPANLPPGAEASFGILPVCVFASAAEVRAIAGMIYIECQDQTGRPFYWSQPATFFIDRSAPSVTVSFGRRPS